jgi:hypothetical protein
MACGVLLILTVGRWEIIENFVIYASAWEPWKTSGLLDNCLIK